MRLSLLLLLSLTNALYGVAQSISFEPEQKVALPENFVVIDMIQHSDQYWVFGNFREPGALNVGLLAFDLEGSELFSQKIGSADHFDRYMDVSLDADGHAWVLTNSFKDENTIQLFQLNPSGEVVDRIYLNNLLPSAAISIAKIDKDDYMILATITENAHHQYAALITYNHIAKNQSIIKLDQKNSYDHHKTIEDFGMDDSTPEEHRAATQRLIDHSKKALYKNANGANQQDDGFVIVGSENTNNLADQWAAKVNQSGDVLWEQVYIKEDDPGVDALISCAPLDDGYMALLGYNYNKRNRQYYSYSYSIIDQNGKLQDYFIYPDGGDEDLKGVLPLDSHFLYFGNERQLSETVTRDISLLLINKAGKQIDRLQYNADTYQDILAVAASDDHHFKVLFKSSSNQENWSYHFGTLAVK